MATAGIVALGLNPAYAADYTQKDLNEQSVMALAWTQTSAEYRALCYQAYNTALERVAYAVAHHQKSDRPLAIVLDIDETVLNNSPDSVRFLGTEKCFNYDDWNEWCIAAEAEAMPGATDFLKAVDKMGVDIFYVSNRTERKGTVKNMKAVGFPLADDKHLLLKEKSSHKQERFSQVAKDYDVIVYMGDNAGDWLPETYHKSFTERSNIADQHQKDFGTKFIVLPNAHYGDWEGALADNYWQLTPKEKSEARKKVLKGWKPRKK